AMAGAVLLFLATKPMPAHASDASSAAALRTAVAAERARTPAPRQAREAFLAPAAIATVSLAPDSRHVAYLRDEGSSRSLWLRSSDGGAPRVLAPRTQATQLRW